MRQYFFTNELFATIILIAGYVPRRSIARVVPRDFENGIPGPLLALTATAVHHALREYVDSGSPAMFEFNEKHDSEIYRRILTNVNALANRTDSAHFEQGNDPILSQSRRNWTRTH